MPTKYLIYKTSELSALNSQFRIQGLTGTATATTVTTVNWQFPYERWISGGSIFLNNHVFGDKLDIKVVDVDNILGYGAGLVLRTFVKDLAICQVDSKQIQINMDYLAYFIPNLYFQCVYTSVGLVNVNIGFNIFSHVPTDI